MLKLIVIVAAVAAGVLLLSDLRGCGSLFPQETVYDETKDESFLLAKEYAAAGRYPEALDAFRRIIQEHPDASAESNLEAGLIAFQQGDFPLAIYHFNQYLWQRPDASSRARERVVGLINSSKKRFVQEMLPGRVAEPESSVPGLEEKYLAVTGCAPSAARTPLPRAFPLPRRAFPSRRRPSPRRRRPPRKPLRRLRRKSLPFPRRTSSPAATRFPASAENITARRRAGATSTRRTASR